MAGPIQTGSGAQPYQPNRPVLKPGETIETGTVRKGISTQKTSEQQAIQQTASKPQQAVEPFKTVARKMSMRDIVSQLFKYGIEASKENRNLAVKMLLMGMELSKSNLNRLIKLVKGSPNDSFMQDAAILAMKKGLDDSPAALKILANFLKENPQLAQQLRGMLNNMAALQTALISGQNLLSSSMIAQLTALLSQIDGMLSELPSNLQKKKSGSLFKRGELLGALRSTKALVNGVAEQVSSQPESEAQSYLLNKLLTASKNSQALIESLIAQAVLSKPNEKADSAMSEQYAYWQIPNSLAENPQNIELLIKKDKDHKNKINSQKTKIVLVTETRELGELGIEMDVEENNLNIKFNSPESKIGSFIKAHMEDLQRRMAVRNYKTKNIQVVQKHLNTKEFLIPRLDLDDLRRIQAEV
jgi:hypothetical protein